MPIDCCLQFVCLCCIVASCSSTVFGTLWNSNTISLLIHSTKERKKTCLSSSLSLSSECKVLVFSKFVEFVCTPPVQVYLLSVCKSGYLVVK